MVQRISDASGKHDNEMKLSPCDSIQIVSLIFVYHNCQHCTFGEGSEKIERFGESLKLSRNCLCDSRKIVSLDLR
jgi:hypothetical protein